MLLYPGPAECVGMCVCEFVRSEPRQDLAKIRQL